jgi:class 3 adenylate cyclase
MGAARGACLVLMCAARKPSGGANFRRATVPSNRPELSPTRLAGTQILKPQLPGEANVPDLPTGIVTFLFTDIEGSTRLVQELGPDRYGEILGMHSALLRGAVQAHEGVEFGTEGDAHFFAFADPAGALRAAVDAQRALGAADWPIAMPLRVRMGVHTGHPEVSGSNYVGVDLNRVARISAAGHGGQVLASEGAQALASGAEASVRFVDLGRHRLKDLVQPEHIFQVVAPELLVDFPPIRSIDTRPKQIPAQVASFVGRGHELAEVQQLLADQRLVTLTGPGGSGKTRLAIAAADPRPARLRGWRLLCRPGPAQGRRDGASDDRIGAWRA